MFCKFERVKMRKKIFSRIVVISFLCFVLLGSGCQFQKASCAVQEPWKFVVTGDSRGGDNGVNTVVLKELAAEIANINPEFVLFPGDLVNGYNSQEELESQLKTWRQAMAPIWGRFPLSRSPPHPKRQITRFSVTWPASSRTFFRASGV